MQFYLKLQGNLQCSKCQGAFHIHCRPHAEDTPKVYENLCQVGHNPMPFFAVFALITSFSTPTSRRLHTSTPQNFKTHAEDLWRNPYKMQPGVSVKLSLIIQLYMYNHVCCQFLLQNITGGPAASRSTLWKTAKVKHMPEGTHYAYFTKIILNTIQSCRI